MPKGHNYLFYQNDLQRRCTGLSIDKNKKQNKPQFLSILFHFGLSRKQSLRGTLSFRMSIKECSWNLAPVTWRGRKWDWAEGEMKSAVEDLSRLSGMLWRSRDGPHNCLKFEQRGQFFITVSIRHWTWASLRWSCYLSQGRGLTSEGPCQWCSQ